MAAIVKIIKLGIVGSREFPNSEDVREYISQLVNKPLVYNNLTNLLERPYIIVSGGAQGVDTWAETMALKLGFKTEIYKADWDKLGKSAGWIRNKQIVDVCDKIVAFWDGESKGTKMTIDLAIQAGKPVDIFVRKK